MICEVGRMLIWQQGYLAGYNLIEADEKDVCQDYSKVQKGQNLFFLMHFFNLRVGNTAVVGMIYSFCLQIL